MTTITISAGQTLSDTNLGSNNLIVAYGGTSTSNSIGPNATETVFGFSFGDMVSGTSSTRAQLIAQSGAFVSGTEVLAGAEMIISYGASVYAPMVSGGTIQADNATLRAATIVSGEADVGGQVIGGQVGAGGRLALVGDQAVATGVTVASGGSLNIALNTAIGTVLNGGTATVDGDRGFIYGQAKSTIVNAGGVLSVASYAFESGTVVSSGGLDTIDPLANSIGVIIAGGTLELDYGTDDPGYGYVLLTAQENGPITFSGNGGVLRDDGNVTPTSVISGFNATDRIVIAAIPADPKATLTTSGDFATISAGGQTYTLDIVGASTLPLTLGIGTTAGIIDIGVACYCAGTAILTAEGEVAVETIAPGDLVITADGRAEPVVWIGRRSYAGRFLQRQRHLLPIRIQAGALGRRLPRRDLLVSPNHALLLDGVLVPAGALVDGRRITVEHGCTQVDYVHLELARHDVILAEGAAAETFMDDGSRGLFQVGHGTPGAAGTWCAPRLADGFELDAIRRRLAA